MAKTDWKFNDIVTETDMNELGQEVNDQAAAIGDMSTVPTEAKDAAGAIGELHGEKLDQAGGKMTGALFVETAAREISAGSWADMSANSTGYALFAQNCYTAHNNEYRYSNTNSSLGARGIRFNHTTASVEYFDTGAIATAADLAFTPNWINMRPDTAATANRTILRDANGRAKVAAPMASDDIARLDTVQNFGYGATSGTGSAYTAAIGLVSALTEGLRVTIKLHAANGASPTLNINGLGAKAIVKPSGSAPTVGLLKASSIYTLIYNGAAFTLQGEGGEYGTAIAADVLEGKSIGTETGIVTGTMSSRAGVQAPTSTAQWGNGDLAAYLSPGYYNGELRIGVAQLQAAEPDLWSPNIKNGITIFGITGTLAEWAYNAGDIVQTRYTSARTTSSMSPVVGAVFEVTRGGTFKFEFKQLSNNVAVTSYVQLYRNGLAYGNLWSTNDYYGINRSESLTLTTGDKIQFMLWVNNNVNGGTSSFTDLLVKSSLNVPYFSS
ncbi:hypothetical protein SAMN04487969_11022 [Paenibacillus algorifonticola]|uniref:Uncharacterized protein n=1 Tax=Paenibacillus algorifonticola TaxID=684063 RepID=A0A1I2EUL8_9BACL|nr:hypothetical protein [Paenibacillus algorifonticola]SFE96011.1 hypothetical protein SAMN04487969_11022 [Paenibacillus algorifonticola]